MNLVQINERLKDLPMQVIQQYANGMNPEVPPYLALGELQRREIAQKQMANTQGAAQGPQPSIKEQVEQKAGLMQLQQMQQQQMQQMQQPRGPMPVPAGVPQPQMQPEIAMARGGLAGIPVRRDMFEYAGGGIIAFQTGGQSLNERAARQMQEKGSIYDPFFGLPPEERKRKKEMADLQAATDRSNQSMAVTESNVQALVETARARISELAQNREELTRKFGPRMYEQALNRAQQAVDAATTRGSELMAEQANRGQERITAATPPPEAPYGSKFAPVNPADMMGSSAGLPAALAKADPTSTVRTAPPRPVAQPAAAMPSAVPQAPMQTSAPAFTPSPVSADRAGLEALMKSQQRQAPTAAGIIADVNALKPAGMQDEAQAKLLADQRARAEERKAMFERSKPSGLDDLIRVFGQSGQFKGGTGFAPAYTANQDRKRAQELAFQKEQDELLTAIEGRGAAFDKDTFTARTGAMSRAQELFGQSEKSIIDAAAKLYVADQGRLDADNKAKMDRDLRDFEAAQRRSLEMMTITQRERESKRTDARSPVAKATEYVNLKAQARAEIAKGTTAGNAAAAEMNARADDMKGFQGGASGDRGPSPTDRLRAAQSILNDFEATPDEKALARKEVANIMAGGGASGGAPTGAPPAQAIEALRKNPKLAAQFDEKYGKGASAQYLQK